MNLERESKIWQKKVSQGNEAPKEYNKNASTTDQCINAQHTIRSATVAPRPITSRVYAGQQTGTDKTADRPM